MTSNGTQVPIKRDWPKISEFCQDARTPERIFAHYQIEKALAAQLLNSDQDARLSLYAEVYSKLFTSLEDHPQNRNEYRDDRIVNLQTRLLRTLVQKGARFGELGAGDCKLSLNMCDHCSSVNAIDVTDALLPPGEKPANFQFVKIDGIHLPFADNSLDFMFSDQLMEHLHPDDAVRQLSEVYRVLAPGGAYYCITPNAVTGPHDISVYFDKVACGFHLKEYSYRELSRAFTGIGLRKQAVLFGHGAVNVLVSAKIGIMLEMVMQGVWRGRSRPPTNSVLRHLMGIRLLGYK